MNEPHEPPTGPTVALPVTWSRPVETEVARRGMETLTQILLELPDAFDVCMRIAAGGGIATSAALLITGVDLAHAAAVAARVRTVAAVTVPFLGFDEPTVAFEGQLPGLRHRVVRVDGPGRSVVHTNAAPWVAAAALPSRCTMDVNLRRLDLDDVRVPEVRCSIELSGESGDTSLIAALVAADTAGAVRLGASTGRATPSTLPLPMVAHLLASPCRISDAWPMLPLPPAGAMSASFDRVVPPHGVVFGGSGQGKTTFMEHRVQAGVRAGRQVIVVCPTGDLASRAASVLAAEAVPFDAVDFGDDEVPPRMNVCQPPSWVDPETHVADMVDAIEAAWLGAMTTEMFGPVCRRGLRAGLNPLVRDPDGSWPLLRLDELLAAGPLPTQWEEVLERIGDPQQRSLLLETRRAIEKDTTQNYGPWILSKIEPFVGSPRLRRIIDHRFGTVQLERILDGRSLVVSAPASALGDTGSTVMMGLLVSQIWHLVRSLPGERRLAIDLVLDEVQRVPAPLLRTLFAEVRKYGVRLLVATQSTSSLDRETLSAVLANSGAIGTFRVGPTEAAVLDQKFPSVPAGVLQRLGRHHMAVTVGEVDLIGPTERPLVDALDRDALTAAHRALVREVDGARVDEAVVASSHGPAFRLVFAPPAAPQPEGVISDLSRQVRLPTDR